MGFLCTEYQRRQQAIKESKNVVELPRRMPDEDAKFGEQVESLVYSSTKRPTRRRVRLVEDVVVPLKGRRAARLKEDEDGAV